MRKGAIGVIAAMGTLLAACGGSGSGQHAGSKDSFGDPYITDAQGKAIKVGQNALSAFESLGGKADSGANGVQAVPPLSYDYPIVDTGHPDDPMDTKAVWWQVCVKDGVVTGKNRGKLDNLPTFGC